MRAMIMQAPHQKLQMADVPVPTPNANQVLIKVHACGICRTDLHILDGELSEPTLPLILGHQIVGTIVACGKNSTQFNPGQRVGVPWLGHTCGHCVYCVAGQENLCDTAQFTGYQLNGGFAEFCVADAAFCFPIPDGYADQQAAPLLCAGLIGYRTLIKAGASQRIGIYGFGAAAHIVIQMARYQGRVVYAYTRPGDVAAQTFALQLGAVWAGGSDEIAPVELDAALIFAPAGELVPIALCAVKKGGIVVCGGIHMSDIPSFPYDILWGERTLCSVANLTQRDGAEFLALAPKIPIQTEVHTYPLENANAALEDLRQGRFTGAAVILIGK